MINGVDQMLAFSITDYRSSWCIILHNTMMMIEDWCTEISAFDLSFSQLNLVWWWYNLDADQEKHFHFSCLNNDNHVDNNICIIKIFKCGQPTENERNKHLNVCFIDENWFRMGTKMLIWNVPSERTTHIQRHLQSSWKKEEENSSYIFFMRIMSLAG